MQFDAKVRSGAIDGCGLVDVGEVPVNVYGVGVFFKDLFSRPEDELDHWIDMFGRIVNEHKFQTLGQATKGGTAFRKGIYLTPVVRANEDELHFKLLRCSTTLDGPTENFNHTDWRIVNKVNEVCSKVFTDAAQLNHVLAQTYHNTMDEDNHQHKAKISEHSDKTKDMPSNGLIAFCSFYDLRNVKFERSSTDPYDLVYGKSETSILTKLRFRLKPSAPDQTLQKQFDITLYCGSVFVIPLSTNRYYTHEIVPSVLPADKIPTRMGYVIRCSNTDVVFSEKTGRTHFVSNGKMLEPSTQEGIKKLKQMYFLENTTCDVLNYKLEDFNFSMNQGDYLKPSIGYMFEPQK